MPLNRRIRQLSILFLSFLASCMADDLTKLQKPDWNPEVAIALVDSRFGIDRIISKFEEGGFLTSDDDGLVIVVYEKELFTVKAGEVLKLQDFAFDLALYQQIGQVPYNVGNYALKTIWLESGDLRVHIEHNLQEDIRVTLNMPRSSKVGVPFSETFKVQYKGGNTLVFDTVMNLANYKLDLSGSGNQRNKLSINYTAEKVANGASVNLDEFIVSFENLEYDYIDGYLGELDLGSFNDSLKIDAFKNFKSGRIILADPKIDFLVDNGFGLPITITFTSFKAIGPDGSSDLQGDLINNGIDVVAPSNPGDTSSTNTKVNDNNSNLSQFLAITPGELLFTINVDANLGGDSSVVNFISKNSELTADVDLELPLKGSLDSVVIEDIYDFSNQDLKKADQVQFKLFTRNAFPVGIYLQIYFLDENEFVLDSLIQDNDVIFREAITDANGFSVQPMDEESVFTIGELRFGEIKEATTKLKIRAMLLTDASSQKVIGIRNTDYFDIKLGARAIIRN